MTHRPRTYRVHASTQGSTTVPITKQRPNEKSPSTQNIRTLCASAVTGRRRRPAERGWPRVPWFLRMPPPRRDCKYLLELQRFLCMAGYLGAEWPEHREPCDARYRGGCMRQARIHEVDVEPGATKLVVVVAVLSATAAVGELLRPVHLALPDASAGIETAITALGVAAAGLLVRRYMHSRRFRDLLLLLAVVAVSLTDFAFDTAPALAGTARPVAGTSAWTAMLVLGVVRLCCGGARTR